MFLSIWIALCALVGYFVPDMETSVTLPGWACALIGAAIGLFLYGMIKAGAAGGIADGIGDMID